MHDARAVRGVERIGEGARHVDEERHIEQSASQPFVQRLALQQLHHEKRPAVRRLADIVYGADVRVLERSDGFGLAAKALPRRRRLVELGGEHFDRDVASELCVTSPVDLAHAARANRGDNLVPAEADAWRERHPSQRYSMPRC